MDVRDPIDSGDEWEDQNEEDSWDDSDSDSDADDDEDDVKYIDVYERFQQMENESSGEALERIRSANQEKEMEKMEKERMLAEDRRHIQIQDFGRARIELPTVIQSIYPFWDTPEPHIKDLDVLLRRNKTVGAHLHTVDLRNITGVTFFYHKGDLMAIHAHTATEPTAVSTFQRLWRVDYKNLLWSYLPLPAGDRILRFGLRSDVPPIQVLSLLITTKLSGNLYIGPDVPGEKRFSQKVPTMLIHDLPRKGGIVNVAVVGEKLRETLPKPRFPFRPVAPQHVELDLSINSMTLRDAKHITVFNDVATGYFKGILLEYEDGSQRACGQCRMGVDPVKEYVRPAFICMREVAGTRRRFNIPHYELECNMGKHKHGNGRGSKGWKCSDARTMSITVSCDDEVSEPWIYFSEP
ncbi:hypothetical protein FIE12Z_166 [Fusarium flagelliforme]|uniref:Uncharacterized protein n=1 Tax=Fusarium flagelliforme TaxID=2675880 RepID=A0A395N6L6_9HYPO|nr:hypothetical protein FIE12Z_166 [Fusarium flagelliforme]